MSEEDGYMDEEQDDSDLSKAKEMALVGSVCLGFSAIIFLFNRDASGWHDFFLNEQGIVGTGLLLCAIFSFIVSAGFYHSYVDNGRLSEEELNGDREVQKYEK